MKIAAEAVVRVSLQNEGIVNLGVQQLSPIFIARKPLLF